MSKLVFSMRKQLFSLIILHDQVSATLHHVIIWFLARIKKKKKKKWIYVIMVSVRPAGRLLGTEKKRKNVVIFWDLMCTCGKCKTLCGSCGLQALPIHTTYTDHISTSQQHQTVAKIKVAYFGKFWSSFRQTVLCFTASADQFVLDTQGVSEIY